MLSQVNKRRFGYLVADGIHVDLLSALDELGDHHGVVLGHVSGCLQEALLTHKHIAPRQSCVPAVLQPVCLLAVGVLVCN